MNTICNSKREEIWDEINLSEHECPATLEMPKKSFWDGVIRNFQTMIISILTKASLVRRVSLGDFR